jgi:hypothetical protein
MGTGCIFNGYEKEYTEDDEPDFFGSSYFIGSSCFRSSISCYKGMF